MVDLKLERDFSERLLSSRGQDGVQCGKVSRVSLRKSRGKFKLCPNDDAAMSMRRKKRLDLCFAGWRVPAPAPEFCGTLFPGSSYIQLATSKKCQSATSKLCPT